MLIIWRHSVLERLDILSGRSKGSISSIYRQEQSSPRMTKGRSAYVCLHTPSLSMNQVIQLFTPVCHSYYCIKRKIKKEHSDFAVDRLLHSFWVKDVSNATYCLLKTDRRSKKSTQVQVFISVFSQYFITLRRQVACFKQV